METFAVLVVISFIYAVVAAYKWKNKDSQITGFFLAQICFCYFLSFDSKVTDSLSSIIIWHLGTLGCCLLGGSIGGIIGEYLNVEGKRTIGHWLYLALVNLIVFVLGVILLIFSL